MFYMCDDPPENAAVRIKEENQASCGTDCKVAVEQISAYAYKLAWGDASFGSFVKGVSGGIVYALGA